MKKAVLSVMMAAALGAAPLVHATQKPAGDQGGTSVQDVRQRVTDAVTAIGHYTAAQRDEAARKGKAALDALDARIAVLQAQADRQWDKMDQAARRQTREDLARLQKQRIRVAEWYGGLENSSTAAWGHVKKGFVEAFGSLRHAWDKTEQDFRHNEAKP